MLESVMLRQFVILVKRLKAINYLIQFLPVFLPSLYNLFSLMCGGLPPSSVGRHTYYVSFIDDYSKFSWIYLLKKRSDVFQVFLNFQALVERQFDCKILALQSDWGGEYRNLNSFFQQIGISHHVSCPHAHQQNGSAERKHRHIVEVGLALLAAASMPLKFWDEAFLTAVHLINMLPSRVINNESPVERLLHTKPDYTSL